MNMALIHVNLRGTIGVAIVGSSASNIVGGICETYLRRNANNRFNALNTALVTTESPSGTVTPWTQLVATAHELGEQGRGEEGGGRGGTAAGVVVCEN